MDGVLIRRGDNLILNQDVVRVDLWEFEEAVKGGDHQTAIELFGGPFLAGYGRKVGPEVEHWIESQNSRLEGQLEIAYSSLITDAIENGDESGAVEYARRFVRDCPLNDTAQTTLVRALRINGDEIGALGVYHEYRTMIARAFGDKPDPSLEASIQRMRDEIMRIPDSVVHGSRGPRKRKRRGPDRRSSAHKHRLAWSLAAGATIIAAAVATAAATRNGPNGPLSQISAQLLVLTEHGADTTLALMILDGNRVNVEPATDLGGSDLPSPDGSRIAFAQAASDGWNLAVRGAASQEEETLTTTPQDEFPIAWSPDGKYLLYTRRIIPRAGRRYLYEVQIFDLMERVSRRLTTLQSTQRPTATWSPDGTRIMFTVNARGRADIFAIDFDGQNLRNVTRHDGTDTDPDWRPDAERVAFVSETEAGIDVMTMRPDGSDLQPMTRSSVVEREPRWVSPGIVVFIADAERGSDLWALDVFSGETRQLSHEGNLVGIRTVYRAGEKPSWIDGIAISPQTHIASPGQHITLQVNATTVDSDTLPVEGLPIRWSASDDRLIRWTGPGQIQIDSVGRAAVIVSAAGWRSDSMEILSVPLVELPIQPVIVEDWLEGLDVSKWLPFGDPSPITRRQGGPDDGGVFINNGDAFFESGAVLRTPIPLNNGATIETSAKLQFTGRLHQTFGIALRATLPADSIELGSAGSLVDFRIQGPSADEPLMAWMATPEERFIIPFTGLVNEWRSFALQILPDGTIELVLDEMMYWRSPHPVEGVVQEGQEAYVTLGYRSSRTEILTGPVRVYLIPKFRLPAPPLGTMPQSEPQGSR